MLVTLYEETILIVNTPWFPEKYISVSFIVATGHLPHWDSDHCHSILLHPQMCTQMNKCEREVEQYSKIASCARKYFGMYVPMCTFSGNVPQII